MIEIVNKKDYVGPGEYIGRPSPLGNIYSFKPSSVEGTIVVSSRKEAIDKYEEWLDAQPEDSPAKQELKRLANKYKESGKLVLICWCVPKHCHGHVLAKKIMELV